MDNNIDLITVQLGGSLDLKGNAKLTGNKGMLGGGIYAVGDSGVGESVTVSMSGNAEISGNTVPSIGGGIFIGGYDTIFTISENAVIKNNTAPNNGGGVYLARGSFIMNGGEISGNTATTGNGGGVYINAGANFTVASEQVKAGIHGNTAPSGPQVYVYSGGTFTVGGAPTTSY